MDNVKKCLSCGKIGENAFSDPYDVTNISPYHSPRSEKEYYFKCPFCGAVTIYP